MKMTITLTPTEILEAIKVYAVDTLEVPGEVAERLVLEYYDFKNSTYADATANGAGSTIRAVVAFYADNYAVGPYR